jgi:hypothetical protein
LPQRGARGYLDVRPMMKSSIFLAKPSHLSLSSGSFRDSYCSATSGCQIGTDTSSSPKCADGGEYSRGRGHRFVPLRGSEPARCSRDSRRTWPSRSKLPSFLPPWRHSQGGFATDRSQLSGNWRSCRGAEPLTCPERDAALGGDAARLPRARPAPTRAGVDAPPPAPAGCRGFPSWQALASSGESRLWDIELQGWC